MKCFNKNDFRSGLRERAPVHYIYLSFILFFFLSMAKSALAMDKLLLRIYDLGTLPPSQFNQALLTHSYEITTDVNTAETGETITSYKIQQQLLKSQTARHPQQPARTTSAHVSTCRIKTPVTQEQQATPTDSRSRKKKKKQPATQTCSRPIKNLPQLFRVDQRTDISINMSFDQLTTKKYILTVDDFPGYSLQSVSRELPLPPDDLIQQWAKLEEKFGLTSIGSDSTGTQLNWTDSSNLFTELISFDSKWSGSLLDIVLGIDCRWEIFAVLIQNPDNPLSMMLLGLQLIFPNQENSLLPPEHNFFAQLGPLNPAPIQLNLSQNYLTTDSDQSQQQTTAPVPVPQPQNVQYQTASGSHNSQTSITDLSTSLGKLSVSGPSSEPVSTPSSTASSVHNFVIESGSGRSSRGRENYDTVVGPPRPKDSDSGHHSHSGNSGTALIPFPGSPTSHSPSSTASSASPGERSFVIESGSGRSRRGRYSYAMVVGPPRLKGSDTGNSMLNVHSTSPVSIPQTPSSGTGYGPTVRRPGTNDYINVSTRPGPRMPTKKASDHPPSPPAPGATEDECVQYRRDKQQYEQDKQYDEEAKKLYMIKLRRYRETSQKMKNEPYYRDRNNPDDDGAAAMFFGGGMSGSY